ncbi:MoxR-like ATPase [Silvimonas terrae]|uniref:MoxR-like ATPase n=1 Tax=Silvimonas terrae TaxID=300266 RepID=A0A840REF4_9NEIS|nr:MoxR family ATPase [Silvimonas terrae]MBB5190733.1 MoxR-like ATPase [Silvimonas terrae]
MSSRDAVTRLQQQMETSIKGQSELIRQMLIGLLANGHLLLESLPGLAKTRAVKALASNLDATMRRIQFTPDLLPADITGSDMLYQENGNNRFRFEPGPVFGNLILADEINRAPAKVQAALLEAMEEHQVSVGGNTHKVPDLFMVLATQNPIEQEGTYPLPEAQMDRFLLKLRVSYPASADELEVLRLVRSEETGTPNAALAAATPVAQSDIFAARAEIHAIYVSEAIERYIVDLLWASRANHNADLARWIAVGASPRGGIALDRASRAHAWLEGRDHVTPDDIRAVVLPALRHRLVLSYDAYADGLDADAVVNKLVQSVAVPA